MDPKPRHFRTSDGAERIDLPAPATHTTAWQGAIWLRQLYQTAPQTARRTCRTLWPHLTPAARAALLTGPKANIEAINGGAAWLWLPKPKRPARPTTNRRDDSERFTTASQEP